MTSIYNEWYGLNEFCSLNNPKCFLGGIEGLEKCCKGWTKKFNSQQAKIFSRLKFLILSVKEFQKYHVNKNH